MSVNVNVSGTWKSATPYVNVGGTWKQAQMYVNVSGTWKLVSQAELSEITYYLESGYMAHSIVHLPNGYYVVVGASGGGYPKRYSGTSITALTNYGDLGTYFSATDWGSLFNIGNNVCLFGDSTYTAISTDNGANFTKYANSGAGTGRLSGSIAVKDGIVCCEESNRIISSSDGINWTQRVTPVAPTIELWGPFVCNNYFIAFSGNAMNDQYAYYSTDGINWTTSSLFSTSSWFIPNYMGYCNGYYIIRSDYSSTQHYYLRSTNLTTWTEITSTFTNASPYAGYVPFSKYNDCCVLMPVANTTTGYYKTTDGVNWTNHAFDKLLNFNTNNHCRPRYSTSLTEFNTYGGSTYSYNNFLYKLQ